MSKASKAPVKTKKAAAEEVGPKRLKDLVTALAQVGRELAMNMEGAPKIAKRVVATVTPVITGAESVLLRDALGTLHRLSQLSSGDAAIPEILQRYNLQVTRLSHVNHVEPGAKKMPRESGRKSRRRLRPDRKDGELSGTVVGSAAGSPVVAEETDFAALEHALALELQSRPAVRSTSGQVVPPQVSFAPPAIGGTSEAQPLADQAGPVARPKDVSTVKKSRVSRRRRPAREMVPLDTISPVMRTRADVKRVVIDASELPQRQSRGRRRWGVLVNESMVPPIAVHEPIQQPWAEFRRLAGRLGDAGKVDGIAGAGMELLKAISKLPPKQTQRLLRPGFVHDREIPREAKLIVPRNGKSLVVTEERYSSEEMLRGRGRPLTFVDPHIHSLHVLADVVEDARFLHVHDEHVQAAWLRGVGGSRISDAIGRKGLEREWTAFKGALNGAGRPVDVWAAVQPLARMLSRLDLSASQRRATNDGISL